MSSKPHIVERSWDVDKLIPYEKNAKLHPDEQVAALAAVIEAEGFDQPIVIDENGVVIKGHGRRLAVMKLGWKQVPVYQWIGLTNAQKNAKRISDNAVALGDFDDAMLLDEVDELSRNGYGIEKLGYHGREADKIAAKLFNDYDPAADASLLALFEPEPEEPPKKEKSREQVFEHAWEVTIKCSGEQEQREIYERMTAEGYQCRVLTL